MNSNLSLDAFVTDRTASGHTSGRSCSGCAFFRANPALWDEVKAHRARACPTSWEVIGAWLRTKHGASFSHWSLRGHALHHTEVK